MWLLDQITEQRIAEAIERGELDGLPGSGQPLELDDDSMVPEHLRPAYRLLKNAGFLPPELEPRRGIRDAEALLRQATDPDERSRAARRLRALLARLHSRDRGRLTLQVQDAYYRKLVARLDRASGEPETP